MSTSTLTRKIKINSASLEPRSGSKTPDRKRTPEGKTAKPKAITSGSPCPNKNCAGGMTRELFSSRMNEIFSKLRTDRDGATALAKNIALMLKNHLDTFTHTNTTKICEIQAVITVLELFAKGARLCQNPHCNRHQTSNPSDPHFNPHAKNAEGQYIGCVHIPEWQGAVLGSSGDEKKDGVFVPMEDCKYIPALWKLEGCERIVPTNNHRLKGVASLMSLPFKKKIMDRLNPKKVYTVVPYTVFCYKLNGKTVLSSMCLLKQIAYCLHQNIQDLMRENPDVDEIEYTQAQVTFLSTVSRAVGKEAWDNGFPKKENKEPEPGIGQTYNLMYDTLEEPAELLDSEEKDEPEDSESKEDELVPETKEATTNPKATKTDKAKKAEPTAEKKRSTPASTPAPGVEASLARMAAELGLTLEQVKKAYGSASKTDDIQELNDNEPAVEED